MSLDWRLSFKEFSSVKSVFHCWNIFVSGTKCLDVRQEQCYTRYKHGKCVHPIDGLFHKSLCCCSQLGKAWGDRCESCPRAGTSAFAELCPKGLGFLDRKDINECTEFPGICQNGRCKNTIGGYNCRCNKGYDFDENKITCVGKTEYESVFLLIDQFKIYRHWRV